METKPTRRQSLQYLMSFPAAASAVRAQELIGEPAGRIAPLAELVNIFEVQAMARRKLSDQVYATVAGTDHRGFERITFRPRLMVNTSKLDLTTELFGVKLFAPIVVGPTWYQQVFHPDGELAMVRGASAAKTLMVVSSRSSRPLREIVGSAKTPLWFQAYPDADISATIQAAQRAVEAGCKAVCLTVGVPYQGTDAGGQTSSAGRLRATGSLNMDWALIDRIKRSMNVPVLLKGIMSPEEAVAAAAKGIDGVVVSNHGGLFTSGFAEPITVLPSIADAVGGKIPILIDGSFRRGTDVLKAIALGASAVLVARPPVWGLAAYGAEGVQAVLEMLQTELARNMAGCGRPDIKSIDRSLVKIHKW